MPLSIAFQPPNWRDTGQFSFLVVTDWIGNTIYAIDLLMGFLIGFVVLWCAGRGRAGHGAAGRALAPSWSALSSAAGPKSAAASLHSAGDEGECEAPARPHPAPP